MLNILNDALAWQQIFEQEGIIYNILSNIPDEISDPIIVNRNLNEMEALKIRRLLNTGLAILTDFPILKKIVSNFNYRNTKIPYLLSNSTNIFENIIALDLELDGYRSESMIYDAKYGKGYIIALPFDVNQAINDTRSERKLFYYPSRKFPNEIITTVNKGAVRKLVINCIRKLYAKMNLPYVHLWYYPNEYKSTFAFRIDTDFGPENTLQATFDLEEKTGVKFTYFVNTKDHPNLVKNKRDFQIHCYTHEVYKNYQGNFDNIQKAKSILEHNGIKPIGFVSPFGFWNDNLQKAMEDSGIQYSSEFSLAYDDLPFYPVVENRRSSVLQIPVHPICIGRLVHAGLSSEKCIDYYKRYFDRQVQANEPIFIYDHPHRIAQFTDVFNKIINQAKNIPSIWLTNVTEFYHWWKSRLQSLNNTQWQIENQSLKINTASKDSKVHLRIITPDNKQTFIPLKQTLYNLKDLSYKSIPMTKPTDTEDYARLKSKRTKLQMQFYVIIDKIFDIFKG